MTEKTEISVHDITALTLALDVPCSPDAASCILLNTHAACKLGQSGQLTAQDLAKHDAGRGDCVLNVKVETLARQRHQPLHSAKAYHLSNTPATLGVQSCEDAESDKFWLDGWQPASCDLQKLAGCCERQELKGCQCDGPRHDAEPESDFTGC